MLDILSGHLAPVLHDGTPNDLVYGVDASGAYLGVVPSVMAASVADMPPPKSGNWRWSGGAWVGFKTVDELVLEIERERDSRLAEGAQWSGRTWYADQEFQGQLSSYLQAFSEGLLPADGTASIRAKDRQVYELTHAELRELAGVVLSFVQGVYQWSWVEKEKVRG